MSEHSALTRKLIAEGLRPSPEPSPTGSVRADLEWIAAFATVRAADNSKTFARVNRGALRSIAERARAAVDLLRKNPGGVS